VSASGFTPEARGALLERVATVGRQPPTPADGPIRWSLGDVAKEVLARDRATCYLCNQLGADQVGHLVEVAEGGNNDLINLASCHEPAIAETAASPSGHGSGSR
jgi:5-methylcytosine-specific restriction endonuclease McrA